MPLSVFLGRVVDPGEPLWLDSDRDWALALAAEEADSCGTCGEPREVAQAITSDMEYVAEAIQCHSCAAHARAVRRLGDKTGATDGVMTRIVRRPKGT